MTVTLGLLLAVHLLWRLPIGMYFRRSQVPCSIIVFAKPSTLPVRTHPLHGDGLSLSHLGSGAIWEGDKSITSDASSVVHPQNYIRGRKWNQGPGLIHDHFAVAKADGVQDGHGDALQCQELAIHQAGAAPVRAGIGPVGIDTRAVGQDQRVR